MLGGMYEVDTWSLNTTPTILGTFVERELKSSGNPLLDAIEAMKIQLNIDIDGINPTFAVSGTVSDRRFANSEPSYFIGRATTSPLPNGVRVNVADFRLSWPVSGEIFDEAEIVITRDKEGRYKIPEKERLGQDSATWFAPIASIVFYSQTSGRSAGIFSGSRRSRFFRQLRLFVLREEGASPVEPYDTLSHKDRADRGPSRRVLDVVSALKEAGIRVYSPDDGRTVDQALARDDGKWNVSEVQDALRSATTALAPREKWRGMPPNSDLFLFLARNADDPRLAGVACAIAGPNNTLLGGGAAVFTECPVFHGLTSNFLRANPPVHIAQMRERFFTTMHELGHAMNLVHSDIKSRQFVWPGPWWQPAGIEFATPRSFMSTPGMEQDKPNVSDFYQSFAFHFDDDERLFLRHAPGKFLQPAAGDLDQVGFRMMPPTPSDRSDIRFVIRTLRPTPVLGEPVRAEIRLDTTSPTNVALSDRPDPSNGSVVITVTEPSGRERLFRPIVMRREVIHSVERNRDDEAFYIPVDLTVDAAGIVFGYPGVYTVTATYRCMRKSADGFREVFATSSMPIVVRSPDPETAKVLCSLFDRKVAHVLASGGTRVDQETNAVLADCLNQLPDGNPIAAHLRAALSLPLASDRRVHDGKDIRSLPADPDEVVKQLGPIVPSDRLPRPDSVADTLGNVAYNTIIHTYAHAAVATRNKTAARKAFTGGLALFKDRDAPEEVLSEIEQQIKKL